jgi:hypothetical protein
MRPLYESVKEEKSEADKMFEKLGYRLEHNHYNCDNSDIYTYHEKDRKNFLRFNTADRTFYSLFDKTYTMQELQAINLKCKELGWL